jgi:hypothetical protein
MSHLSSAAPHGLPYSDQSYWPKDADRDHYRAEARRRYPIASDDKIEQLARTFATMDDKLSGLRNHPGVVKAALVEAIPHPAYGFAIIDRDDLSLQVAA